ncbi:rhodanese-like domain-containing protein [Clostridium thermarum]|uniref:rhodanese-like domain-containing protein n=1 Tax=Clostridium thermarum TaxID=1716543 RepID=UPI0013D0A47C|nr:rhodanese-like domain-containing protein [Clostridium thermarum]
MSYWKMPYKNILPSRARKLLNHDPNILLIDVRSPEEYMEAHIPGSVNIPIEFLEWEICNLQLSPLIPIMVYCKTGLRATSAAWLLISLGFITVYNLGGIDRWPYRLER